jgi:hypothetical protein
MCALMDSGHSFARSLLSSNMLTWLPANVFASLFYLESLELSDNVLFALPPNLLNHTAVGTLSAISH